MTKQETHPLDSLTASSLWIDSLLELFWAVDNAVKTDKPLPQHVRDIYEIAEKARKRL